VIARVDRLAVGAAAAVRDPHARARAHHGLERGDEAARRVHHLDGARGAPLVDVGLAVGEHHHPIALEVLAQGGAQALGRPRAVPHLLPALVDEACGEAPEVLHQRLEGAGVALAREGAAQLDHEASVEEARREHGQERGRERQHQEGDRDVAPGRGLAAAHEREVVQQEHRLVVRALEPHRAHVHRPRGQLAAHGAQVARLGPEVSEHGLARERVGVAGRGGHGLPVGAARRGAHDALVVRDVFQRLAQLGRARAPARREPSRGGAHRELGAQAQILVEPCVGHAAQREEAPHAEQREAEHEQRNEGRQASHAR
jgi:hypothetical protein